MSRAFAREDENDKTELPDRPISPHRNFVTEAGLAAIEAALGRFQAAHRAVGEDQADPSRGTISYMSPLARAVLTHGPGETVEMTGGEAVILDVR